MKIKTQEIKKNILKSLKLDKKEEEEEKPNLEIDQQEEESDDDERSLDSDQEVNNFPFKSN